MSENVSPETQVEPQAPEQDDPRFQANEEMRQKMLKAVEADPESVDETTRKAVASGPMVRVYVLFNDKAMPEGSMSDVWKALRQKTKETLDALGVEDLVFLID